MTGLPKAAPVTCPVCRSEHVSWRTRADGRRAYRCLRCNHTWNRRRSA